MWYGEGRRYARLAIDLAWVALSAFAALLIRDNFVPSLPRLHAIIPYALLCLISAAFVFSAARLHRTLWRYTSLPDLLRLMAAVTIALLLALLGDFIVNRLEGVARSLPVIQWFLLLSATAGSRIAIRLLGERSDRKQHQLKALAKPKEHVLVVGVGDLAELYLRSVAEFAPKRLEVVGILSPQRQLQGRFMRLHEILGRPEDVRKILAQLELHGVTVERIVVTQPFEKLSRASREALRDVERSTAIKVDWLIEALGLRGKDDSKADDALYPSSETQPLVVSEESENLPVARYHSVKRVIDAAAAICMLVLLTPVLVLAALFVAIDVGFPIVFWQQRPGRYGRPFKVFKFRTMRAAHDVEGNRIADELRSSSIGRFLRRSWLDELPQLYNILVGEMSLVGPRPLLPIDQPTWQTLRLAVRPGLTGWAQVNGGRDISPEDKAALDVWYIMHASLWLDITILLRTLATMVLGEGMNAEVMTSARAELEKLRTTADVEGRSMLPQAESLTAACDPQAAA